MKYKHFIFDVDGTLVDNEPAVLQTWKDALLEIQGKTYETKDIAFVLGVPGETAFEKFGVENPEAAFELWRRLFLKYSPTVKLFVGISETLASLKEKGKQLGVVTSRTRSEFADDATLDRIADYFGTTICVTDSPRPKPFADPILTYLEKTAAAPQDVLYIGDTVYDCLCAKNAGVDFALAAWGNNSKENITAKYFFNSPVEIAENSRQ